MALSPLNQCYPAIPIGQGHTQIIPNPICLDTFRRFQRRDASGVIFQGHSAEDVIFEATKFGGGADDHALARLRVESYLTPFWIRDRDYWTPENPDGIHQKKKE